MTKRRWTEREDSFIIETVKNNAGNIKEGFRNLSFEIGRTVGAISYRWYNVLSNRTDADSIALMCLSKKTCSLNRKNCKTNTDITESKIRRI